MAKGITGVGWAVTLTLGGLVGSWYLGMLAGLYRLAHDWTYYQVGQWLRP